MIESAHGSPEARRLHERSPELSIVVPIFNEAALVDLLFDRLESVLQELAVSYEVIAVDDGSTDGTFERLVRAHRRNPSVKLLRLSRNFGHQTAITAGLARASGNMVAIMDADLQDRPESLPLLLEKLGEGYDVAYGIRVQRPEGWLKRLAYRAFYRVLRLSARIDIPIDAGDFCVMRRQVVDAINSLPERNRFLRGLRSWFGFRQAGVPCIRGARAEGQPKYGFGKLLRLSLDGLISFSDAPLRLASYLGFLVSLGSFLGILVVLYIRLFTSRSLPGFASVAILILFTAGIQLLTVGVLGEYLGRIFDEVKQRPLYVTRETMGWPMSSDSGLSKETPDSRVISA